VLPRMPVVPREESPKAVLPPSVAQPARTTPSPLVLGPDIATLALAQHVGTTLHVQSLKDFNPSGAVHDSASERSLRHLLGTKPHLNLDATLRLDDPRTAGTHEGIAAVARYLREEFLPKHADVLKSLGIAPGDVGHLTPRQAVLLASVVTMERLEYSRIQTKFRSYNEAWGTYQEREASINDRLATDQVFRLGSDSDGNAVCRNYTDHFIAVLEALKSMQNAGTTRLASTFAFPQIGIVKDAGGSELGWHAWAAVATVDAGHVHATLVDPTFADAEINCSNFRAPSLVKALDVTGERVDRLLDFFRKPDAEEGRSRNLFKPLTPERCDEIQTYLNKTNDERLVRYTHERELGFDALTGEGVSATESRAVLARLMSALSDQYQRYPQLQIRNVHIYREGAREFLGSPFDPSKTGLGSEGMYIQAGTNEAAMRQYCANFAKLQFCLKTINAESDVHVECFGIPANRILDMETFTRNLKNYFDRWPNDQMRLIGEKFRLGTSDEYKSYSGITISYEHFLGRNFDPRALDDELGRTVMTERYKDQIKSRSDTEAEDLRHRSISNYSQSR